MREAMHVGKTGWCALRQLCFQRSMQTLAEIARAEERQLKGRE